MSASLLLFSRRTRYRGLVGLVYDKTVDSFVFWRYDRLRRRMGITSCSLMHRQAHSLTTWTAQKISGISFRQVSTLPITAYTVTGKLYMFQII